MMNQGRKNVKKRAKQFLAVATTATLTLSTGLTVLAAPDLPGDSTVNGGGELDWVDTSPVYEVTLPTNGALDFIIDPQGLTSLANGSSASLDDLLNASSIKTKDNAGAYIKNESSKRIKVELNMNITDDNTGQEVTPVDTLAKVDADDNTNICLLAIPSTNSPADIAGYTGSTQGIVIDSKDDATPTKFSFVLDKAEYQISKNDAGVSTFSKVTGDNNFDAASFKLGGKANGKADWSAYVGESKKTVGVKAVFKVTDAAESDVVGADYPSHGLMTLPDATKVVTVEPDKAAPTINATASVTKGATSVSIPLNLGSGDLAATGIASLQNSWPSVSDIYPMTEGWEIVDNNLVISGTTGNGANFFGNNCQFTTATTITLYVKFNDTAQTAAEVTLTVNPS